MPISRHKIDRHTSAFFARLYAQNGPKFLTRYGIMNFFGREVHRNHRTHPASVTILLGIILARKNPLDIAANSRLS